MVRIVIADDHQEAVDRTEQIVNEYFKTNPASYEVKTYINSEWLTEDLEEKSVADLYLLDIEMPGKKGLELTRIIRDNYPGTYTILITNFVDHWQAGYELAVSRYIPKSSMEEKLPEALEYLIPEILRRQTMCYIVECEGNVYPVNYNDIVKIEHDSGKYCILFTRCKKYRMRKSIKKVSQDLRSEEFICVNKGTIVNMGYAEGIKDNSMILGGGIEAEISRSQLAAVKKRMIEYYRGQM